MCEYVLEHAYQELHKVMNNPEGRPQGIVDRGGAFHSIWLPGIHVCICHRRISVQGTNNFIVYGFLGYMYVSAIVGSVFREPIIS